MHHKHRTAGNEFHNEISVRNTVDAVKAYAVKAEPFSLEISVGVIGGARQRAAADGGNVDALSCIDKAVKVGTLCLAIVQVAILRYSAIVPPIFDRHLQCVVVAVQSVGIQQYRTILRFGCNLWLRELIDNQLVVAKLIYSVDFERVYGFL